MAFFLKFIWSWCIYGRAPHIHQWGKWTISRTGIWTWQQRECAECGLVQERRAS